MLHQHALYGFFGEIRVDGLTAECVEVLETADECRVQTTFVVDRDGVLRWGQAGDRTMVRDGREVLRVLDLVESLRKPGA